ncbi:hypothetical protein QBK99_16010 [Corticibacterium sp. UT-5YL-CI-8]|nr:hypothetical protein [Tianweitania sp. UT-5YL-CI-8]
MNRFVLLAAMTFALPAPALAGPVSDTVRYFYETFKFEGAPEMRDRFADPAKAKFDKNDRLIESGDNVGCIDFSLALDAQDYDEAEVARTLKLEEKLSGDSAEVTAQFRIFAEGDDTERQILWSLENVGGVWKITDIASKTGDWRLSEFYCDSE